MVLFSLLIVLMYFAYTTKHHKAFAIVCRLKIEIISGIKSLPKRMIWEHTKGQSVRETQIVYNTKSDLIVFVMRQR